MLFFLLVNKNLESEYLIYFIISYINKISITY